MNFEEGMVVELLTITKLNNRVCPLHATPRIKPPYMIYEIGDRQEDRTHDGYEDYGAQRCTLDLLCKSYTELQTVGALVETKVTSIVHKQVGGSGPFIQNLEFEDYNPEMYEEQVGLYRKVIEFTVFY
jgi:hypothetical protein